MFLYSHFVRLCSALRRHCCLHSLFLLSSVYFRLDSSFSMCQKVLPLSLKHVALRNCLLFVLCVRFLAAQQKITTLRKILYRKWMNALGHEAKKSKIEIGWCYFQCVLYLSRDNCESWTLIVHYKIRIRHLFWFEKKLIHRDFFVFVDVDAGDNLIVWVDYDAHT